jgi:hypothetical protein
MGLETGSTPAQRPLMRLKRLYGEPLNGIIFPPKFIIQRSYEIAPSRRKIWLCENGKS